MLAFKWLLCIALALLSHQAVCDTVFVALWSTSNNAVPAINVRLVSVPSPSNSYDPITTGTIGVPAATFDVPPGEYDIEVTEPGFYYQTERRIFTSGTQHVWITPVVPGVVIVTTGQHQTQWNMTVPSGHFSQASFTPLDSAYNWGSTSPAGLIMASSRSVSLIAAQAGVYRYYINLFSQNGPNGTFADIHNLTVSVFAGLDPALGWKGTYAAEAVDGSSWYVGDIIVTNPSSTCSNYSWALVNQYGSMPGFGNSFDHEESSPILSGECSGGSGYSCYQMVPLEGDDKVCGQFGDPHYILFDGTGATCGNETYSIVVDNEWFTLATENQIVASNGATSIVGVRFTYKAACNPISIYFTQSASANVTNAPGAGTHDIRVVRNNIFIDAIHLRMQVRQIAPGILTFGISFPEALVNTSTGICRNSCNPGTEMSLNMAKRSMSEMNFAMEACAEAGLTSGTFEYEACIFDVATTGDVHYASSASAMVAVKTELNQTWEASPIEAPPSESDTPTLDQPSDDSPSSPSTPSTPSSSPSPDSAVPAAPSSANILSMASAMTAAIIIAASSLML